MPLLLVVALLCAHDVLAGGAMRFRGFPSRQALITRMIIIPGEPVAKLPPPVAPGMDKTTSVAEPFDVKLEQPIVAAKPIPIAPDAVALQKIKIKAERERLNHNALLWQRERSANGSASATRSLAFRYLTGDGVEKDQTLGMDLLRKAAADGDSAAQKELAKREREPAKKE